MQYNKIVLQTIISKDGPCQAIMIHVLKQWTNCDYLTYSGLNFNSNNNNIHQVPKDIQRNPCRQTVSIRPTDAFVMLNDSIKSIQYKV